TEILISFLYSLAKIAKGAQLTASLVFDLACNKGAGHAAQHVMPDNVATVINAEGTCCCGPRVVDRGVIIPASGKAPEGGSDPKGSHNHTVRVDIPSRGEI